MKVITWTAAAVAAANKVISDEANRIRTPRIAIVAASGEKKKSTVAPVASG